MVRPVYGIRTSQVRAIDQNRLNLRRKNAPTEDYICIEIRKGNVVVDGNLFNRVMSWPVSVGCSESIGWTTTSEDSRLSPGYYVLRTLTTRRTSHFWKKLYHSIHSGRVHCGFSYVFRYILTHPFDTSFLRSRIMSRSDVFTLEILSREICSAQPS